MACEKVCGGLNSKERKLLYSIETITVKTNTAHHTAERETAQQWMGRQVNPASSRPGLARTS